MSQYCYACMRAFDASMDSCPFCGEPLRFETPVHRLRPGTVLDGRYLVGRTLGQGGFGITYIGRDTTLDLCVAIKEYYPNGYSARDTRVSNELVLTGEDKDGFFHSGKEKFLREAKILAKFCDEPGIVGVRDFFEENNTAYIVMEFLDGITLKEYISERGPLPMGGVLSLMHPVVDTMAKVHESGVIHRDISPDNILLLPDGRPKLLDFGAARDVSDGKSMSVMLKCGYAPEEQYRRKGNQGPWTDVYALCATMYFCLTGRAPEESIERFWNEKDTLIPPSELGAKIQPWQEAALMKGMSLKIEDRYPSMAELEEALYPAREQTLTSFSLGDGADRARPPREKRRERSQQDEGGAPRRKERAAEPEEQEELSYYDEEPASGRTQQRAPKRKTPTRERREARGKYGEDDAWEEPERRKIPWPVVLLVAACLLMVFFAAMLLRELAGTHRAAAPTPQPAVTSSQPSGDDSLASVEFIGVAQQSTSSVVDSIRLYRGDTELNESSGLSLRVGDSPVTLTAKAYTGAPVSGLTYTWATGDSDILRLTPSDDGSTCACELLRSISGGVTLTVSCGGKVVTIAVYPG